MIQVKLDNEIVSRLLSIERANEQFGGIRLPVKISDRLRKSSRKKSSYASVKIEGNPLTEEQASEAIDSSRRHYLKPEQEVRNYYQALEFLERQLAARHPLDRELILATQAIVVQGESSEKTGIRGPMPPGVLFAVYDDATGRPEYIPPQASDIEPLLAELIDYIATGDDHPILKAAILHYQLVTIHPFEDGNGRTARLMGDYLLDLSGYGFNRVGSLEEYFCYDIEEYYRSLQMGLPAVFYDGRENPPHPEIWIHYFLRMVELHAKRAVELASGSQKARLDVALTHLGKRERSFYDYLRTHGIEEFQPIDLATKFKVTNRTVINWCAALVKCGLLEPRLGGRRIRSYIVR
ncbi:MAG: Fic family protein [Kiritimatiellia bacterium]